MASATSAGLSGISVVGCGTSVDAHTAASSALSATRSASPTGIAGSR